MDPSLLLRLVPAFAAAVFVGMHVQGRRRPGDVADEVLRVLMVGLVAGRIGWLLLGGPDVWRNALTTAILIRAGVLTGAGVLVAGWWVARRRDGERWWRLHAAMPMALAGVAVWQASCQVEGVCGGVPVSWGVLLPGRAVPTFPTSYVEGLVAAALAVVAWAAVRRRRPSVAWAVGSAYAFARVLLGLARPTLTGSVSDDQIAFVLVGLVAAVVAWRLRSIDGLAVAFEEGQGPVALLTHGAGSSAIFVREAFGQALGAAGWRLAAMDLRGHGDSVAERHVEGHSLDRHAADLRAVAQWSGAEVLGGVSLGGMAAVRAVTCGADVRAVVAVIPAWTGKAEAGVGIHSWVADDVRANGMPTIIERLVADHSMAPWIRDVVVRDYRRHDMESLAAVLQSLDGGEAPDLEEIKALTVPLVVVGWPDDPGHPLDVSREWAGAARVGALVETSIAAMGAERGAMGDVVVQGLAAVDVRARHA